MSSPIPAVSVAGPYEHLPKDALLEIHGGVRDAAHARELEQKLDQMIRKLAIQFVAPATPGDMLVKQPMSQLVDQGDGHWLFKVNAWAMTHNTGPWMREVKQINGSFENAGNLILFGSYLRMFESRQALGQQLSQEIGGTLEVVHPAPAPTLGERMRQLFGHKQPSGQSSPAADAEPPRRPGLR